LILLLIHAPGCRYGIGGRLPAHLRTVSVPPAEVRVVNPPVAFDLEPILTEAVRDAFLRGNALALLPGRRGDGRIDLVLLNYEVAEDVAEPSVGVDVSYEFIDARSGDALVPAGRVRRESPLDLEGGATNPEEKAFEALAREIGAEVYARTVQGW
jgi:hypothetical protein